MEAQPREVWRRDAGDGPLRIALRVSGAALLVAGTGLGIAPGYYPIDMPDVWGGRLAGTLAYLFLAWTPLLGIAALLVSVLPWRRQRAVQAVGVSASVLLASGLFIPYATALVPQHSGTWAVGRVLSGAPLLVGLLLATLTALCAASIVLDKIPDSRTARRVRLWSVVAVCGFGVGGIVWAEPWLSWHLPWGAWTMVLPLSVIFWQRVAGQKRSRRRSRPIEGIAAFGVGVVLWAFLGAGDFRDAARTILSVGGLVFLVMAWIAWRLWQDPRPDEPPVEEVFE